MKTASYQTTEGEVKRPSRLYKRWQAAQRDLRFLVQGLRGNRGPVVVPRPEQTQDHSSALEWVAIPEYEVDRVQDETEEALSIFLKPTGAPNVHVAGQFLTLVLSDDQGEFRRAYSVVNAAGSGPTLQLTAKSLSGGRASSRALRALGPGDRVRALGPSGKFVWPVTGQDAKEIALYAGGSGITPILSILTTALEQSNQTRVRLLYANRDEASVIFRERLENLLTRFPQRLEVTHMLETPPENGTDLHGRPTAEAIAEWWATTSMPISEAHHFICGPAGMMNVVASTLRDMDISEAKLHQESFSSPESSLRAVTDFERQICVVDGPDGEVRIVVEPGKTILASAIRAGVDLPFSCTMGGCGACQVDLVAGEIEMEQPHCLSDAELSAGKRLTCVGRPLSSIRIQSRSLNHD